MAGWSKKDATKATPYKRGDVKIEHNIYDLVGSNLYMSFKEGKLTRKQLDNMLNQLSVEAKVDLGSGYKVNLGYNVSSGERKDDYRVKLTKDIF